MPKVFLSNDARLVDRIMRSLPKQKEIADALGKSQQTVSYRVKKVYRNQLLESIKLLDLAGYEIKER